MAVQPQSEADDMIERVRMHPLLAELAANEWEGQTPTARNNAITFLLYIVGPIVNTFKHDFAVLEREEALIAGIIRRAAQQHVSLPEYSTLIKMWLEYLDVGGHWFLYEELLHLYYDAKHRQHSRLGEEFAIGRLGTLAFRQGRYDAASTYFSQALKLARSSHSGGESNALGGLGNVASIQGRFSEADRYYREAAAAQTSSKGESESQSFLLSEGTNAMQRGRMDEARQFYAQELEVAINMGNRSREANALLSLGTLTMRQGAIATLPEHFAEAEAYYQQALAIYRDLGDRPGQGLTLTNLSALALAQEDVTTAESYNLEALKIIQDIGDRVGMLQWLSNQARIALKRSQYDEAQSNFELALALARELHDPLMEIGMLIGLGQVAAAQEHPDALDYIQQAMAVQHDEMGTIDVILQMANAFIGIGQPGADASSVTPQILEMVGVLDDKAKEYTMLLALGNQAQEQGETTQSKGYFQDALEISRELGDRAGEGRVLGNLGRLAMNQGQYEQAEQYYVQSLRILESIGAGDAAQIQAESKELEQLRAMQTPVAPKRRRRFWRFGN